VKIHLIANTLREDALEAARSTVSFLREHGVQTGTEGEIASLVGAPGLPQQELADCDLLISFGGDGTLIRGAHLASERGTPLLGVYFGRFGFVTQCQPSEIGAALSLFFDGQARVENRMMLQAQLIRSGVVVATLHSLNEAVLQRAATTRMLEFSVAIDGMTVTQYPADGVIVATPTGSTAYNLSAGGPIVDPQLQALVLSAITPHTLGARPLVLQPDSVIEMSVQTRGDAILSADGQSRLNILSGDQVRITRSNRVTRLVVIAENDFLSKLSEKLLWSHSLGDRE